MQNLFSEKKAAQVAAFFLFQARGRLPVLKLMKLMYLAERRSYQQYGEPIIGDTLVSMEHGPVLSRTLNRINGMTPSAEDGWDMWVSDREGYDVALSDASLIRTPEEDLLELSDVDLSLLAETWAEFGHLSKYQIRDYTHEKCPEWVDPDGSSVPIRMDRLFEVLNFDTNQSQSLVARLDEQRAINSAFASAT